MGNKTIDEIQKQFSNSLEKAALGYFTLGITNFFSERKKSTYAGNQSTIGNLAIAVELALKSFIARKSLLLLFKSLPIEIRVLITNPESVPESFNWRSFEIELKSASYPTIELDECISLFYLFFPECKQTLHSHLKYLSKSRNASVHSILPSFQQEYEVNRVAYAALKVIGATKDELFILGDPAKRYPESVSFLQEFQDKLIEKIHKAIEKAKERAKKLPIKSKTARQVTVSYWVQDVTKCPVCGNLAVLNGTTEKITWTRRGNEQINEPGLWFMPERFHCAECGLTLEDYDEMRLAGIDIDSSEFDRTENIQDYENDQYYSVTYLDQ